MKRVIVKGPGYCAVTENENLVEYIPEEQDEKCGAILLGKIERMMPALNCAFVDIGRKRSGFLPLDENSRSFTGEQVRSGEAVILQIRKEETGEKGAFLSRDITIPGKYIILMPMNRYIGVSSRIGDDAIRENLKQTGINISDNRYGIVMRNAAAEADPEQIRQEAEYLYTVWQQAAELASSRIHPGKILYSDDPVQRLLDDYAAEGIDGITEAEEDDQAIRRQLRQAFERRVRLPGGGNIVIDHCEAMTVIDVNTASASGSGTKGQTVLETNLEACEVLVRQVRLRNLNGIILIDFIDMDCETDRSMVLERLKKCFRSDRIKTVIHGWTSLGIMEMTRKRTRPSLYEQLAEICTGCGGSGYILKEQKKE